MIFIKSSDKVSAVMRAISGVLDQRNCFPSTVAIRVSITNGFPEQGGGGASADVDAVGSDTGGEAPTVAASDDDGDSDDADPDRRKKLRTRNQTASAGTRISSTNKRRDGAVNNMTPPSNAITRTNATISAGAHSTPPLPDPALMRLPLVLENFPISRSGWWAGVKSGRYPAPVRLSARCVAWRSADIRALIQSL